MTPIVGTQGQGHEPRVSDRQDAYPTTPPGLNAETLAGACSGH
jgi:hypothetical protein